MLNKVVEMGRLTADPELKTTASGLSVTSFTIAVDRDRMKDGEKKTDFIRCVAWRKTAEFITKYFGKGRMIAITGQLQQREYTDKNGAKREIYEVVIETAHFCGDRMPEQKQTDEPEPEFDVLPLPDDLPF